MVNKCYKVNVDFGEQSKILLILLMSHINLLFSTTARTPLKTISSGAETSSEKMYVVIWNIVAILNNQYCTEVSALHEAKPSCVIVTCHLYNYMFQIVYREYVLPFCLSSLWYFSNMSLSTSKEI